MVNNLPTLRSRDIEKPNNYGFISKSKFYSALMVQTPFIIEIQSLKTGGNSIIPL